MIEHINHVGIIVRNLEEAVNLYCKLLGCERPAAFKEWPDQGMRNAIIRFGDQGFELMEPLPGTPLAKFLEIKGEGLHHVSLVVKDIKSANESLTKEGAKLIKAHPAVTFVHPQSTTGVLVELIDSTWSRSQS
jgi:methylmalonyl-CoA/ethylmalonyl-CoA epimerase